MCKIKNVKFNRINDLYFSANEITDIKALSQAPFKNLEELDLFDNKIIYSIF